MKNSNSNIQVVISFIIILISFGSLYGQTPTPPTPPTPMMVAANTNTVSVKVNYNHDGSFEEVTNIATNLDYRYTSVFEKDLTPEIEAVLIQALGEPSVISKKIKKWNHIDGKKIEDFQIILRNGKVKIIYKNGTKKVMQELNQITKAICRITYKSNCD